MVAVTGGEAKQRLALLSLDMENPNGQRVLYRKLFVATPSQAGKFTRNLHVIDLLRRDHPHYVPQPLHDLHLKPLV